MRSSRLACLFLLSLASTALLAADPVTFFKTGVGKAIEQKVLNLSSLRIAVGDQLRLQIGNYDDIVVTVRRASTSESDNLVLSGEVSAFLSLTMVIGTNGTVVGSVSTKENSFRLYSENGTVFAKWLDPYNTKVSIGTDVYRAPAGDTRAGEFFSLDGKASLPSRPSNLSLDSKASHAFRPSNLNYPVYSSSETVIDAYIYYGNDLSNPSLVIDQEIETLNWLLENMNADLNARVVGTKRIDVPAGTSTRDVVDKMREREPPFEDIDALIASTGADVVHFLRSGDAGAGDTCGTAGVAVYQGRGIRSSAIGTSLVGGNCPVNTFPHEIGHNLGLKHDRGTVEENDEGVGAYFYSYGSRVPGEYRTVMSYGAQSVYPIFSTYSWPEVTCGNSPCGTSPSESDSADNRRSIQNTKHIVSGFGGDFVYAAIQEFPYTGTGSCDSEEETFKGLAISNSSNYDLEVVYVAYLSGDGSLVSDTDFESLEFIVDPGRSRGWGFCSPEDDHPVGTTIKEAYYAYKNPETGKLIEGTHVFFDNQYSGDYAIVRAAAGPGGSVVGNPSSHTRVNAGTEIAFQPDYGYQLNNVTGTCPGSLHYNVYTAEPVYGDCWAVASFRPLGPAQLIERQFNELPQSVMSFKGN